MNDSDGIQVICAGLGRTGTLSLTDALTNLGYKPYHYVHFSHISQWAEWAQGKRTSKEMVEMLARSGFNATLENPTSDIYQDILKEYPNAKVILTVRDTPTAFVKSWKLLFDTMVITEQRFSWNFPSFLGYVPLFAHLRDLRYAMGTTHLGLQPGELTHEWRHKPNPDEWLAKQYERHNQHIIDHVPKHQLLIFNVKEGWEPLCRFLGKKTPKEPFPYSQVNTKESLTLMRKQFLMVVYGWIPTLVALGAGAIWYHRGGRGRKK